MYYSTPAPLSGCSYQTLQAVLPITTIQPLVVLKRFKGFIALVCFALLVACEQASLPNRSTAKSPSNSLSNTKPTRIVSLDFCADQYVVKMADHDHIVALSPDATKAFSYMRQHAIGIDQVRPTAESILSLNPDLVVRSYGGGPNINRFLTSAGVNVLNVGWAGDIDAIKRVTREMASGLGVPQRGDAIVAEIEARLAKLSSQDKNNVALYMTPSGTTSGSGSLVHQMLLAAGLTNFQTQAGWRSIPLERLSYEQPDMIAAAFFDTNDNGTASWSAMRHPVARSQISELPTVYLDGAWISCGAWFATDAIEALAAKRTAGAND